ncbi:TonB-dependent receptor [Polaribacter reichenbachii]|uniref:TonB-dependent receptor n=1 Tax=Polaribacter reichenbachii TaxID=996801 RepID=A0A1B8U0B3_9FLAO|nr:TonB-dependent receptor [Polaribacter reichenbachii]APZ48154.1 TonB-dependent receptor [Polaribacter reichenbachii]AUC20423.1 TonB-dependent receptor [Polaribacter reichenbachii]OBY65323.1 TonB-dependent receptor [Polaribacter reichenbachii]
MKKIFLFLLFIPSFLIAQKTTILKGTIKNSKKEPVENVSIKFKNTGTSTDKNGNYSIRIPLDEEITIIYSHVSYRSITKIITAKSRNIIRFSPTLILKTEKLNEIVVKDIRKEASGIESIDIKTVKNTIGPNAGVENTLMTFAGVNNNNELSTQYNVRGGNFDENLVYVNGIEVYRPFLIRSGQQEGLSFINTNMVQNINFSAGGFQAKYGDKLSSVLDITYRKPTETATTIDASLLGASVTFEGQFLDKKLSTITGVRYRDNSLFVNSKQIETNFRPKFTDVQTYLTYDFSNKFELSFLGNFSLNNYNYQPLSRRTRFGTVADPLELVVFYSGQEQDKYLTLFSALSANYKVNDNFTLKTTASRYNTQEEEHFDIAAQYNLGEVDSNIGSENFGEVEFSQGIGSQLNHARNDLDALITNLQVRGTIKNNDKQWDFGVKYQKEDIQDRIREWEVIDSLGFSIRPPHHSGNNQPYDPFEGEITPYQSIRKDNNVAISRFSGFVQFNQRLFWNDHEVFYNLGIRAQNWSVTGNGVDSENQTIISPRLQFAIKPDWEKDMLFRVSGGMYAQPPSYRELRDFNGDLNVDVKAQKSIHFVTGMDYSFTMWDRPFKLTTEMYYKDLSDVNAYSIDNVRIRYRADNATTAYAYGLDMRLNGEFVPGSESWVSLGYLKTEENINNQGNIARPSDQRIKFGILFQDYVPNLPDLKAYLNLVYNSGVPGGSPSYSDPYNFQDRLRDYRRADLGVSYVFADNNKQFTTGLLSKFKELTAGLELFNMFDIQNAITNTWVRDVYSKTQYGIPNYMTGRVLNFKVSMKF